MRQGPRTSNTVPSLRDCNIPSHIHLLLTPGPCTHTHTHTFSEATQSFPPAPTLDKCEHKDTFNIEKIANTWPIHKYISSETSILEKVVRRGLQYGRIWSDYHGHKHWEFNLMGHPSENASRWPQVLKDTGTYKYTDRHFNGLCSMCYYVSFYFVVAFGPHIHTNPL